VKIRKNNETLTANELVDLAVLSEREKELAICEKDFYKKLKKQYGI
jgi:hypothetical protein